MNEQPAGKREAGKLARRDRLYEAAVTLFREQGYEHTTVDQITRRAGVAKGTFFNYFPTKDAVLALHGARGDRPAGRGEPGGRQHLGGRQPQTVHGGAGNRHGARPGAGQADLRQGDGGARHDVR